MAAVEGTTFTLRRLTVGRGGLLGPARTDSHFGAASISNLQVVWSLSQVFYHSIKNIRTFIYLFILSCLMSRAYAAKI